MELNNIYRDKTVLVTGCTGFKGTWLSEWLLLLGARVVGYSLPPTTTPSCFDVTGIAHRLTHNIEADVRSLNDVEAAIEQHQPDFIFHLAAQPLVKESYKEPHATVTTNCIGSMNILEALRNSTHPCIVIMVTTDKVYENKEWDYAYRENDALGGHDVYSASKACAEIVISSYRRSFFSHWHSDTTKPIIAIASVRGGNVIGGGDWAENRIIPDCMRCLANGQEITIRNPTATRPWQHVLELIGGYLQLAAQMQQALEDNQLSRLQTLCSSFNFGPHNTSNKTVAEIVKEVIRHWGSGQWLDASDNKAHHEAGKLHLSIEKAHHVLKWQPCLTFTETVTQTVEWYRQYYTAAGNKALTEKLCQQQIFNYENNINT
ncbi:MAG: CDP-glucose 4,6-dehydratase [Proteobacteria bacterium]|nr:CDP-glucose 4,6-dehydratase [Pseudomonadota bacterium]